MLITPSIFLVKANLPNRLDSPIIYDIYAYQSKNYNLTIISIIIQFKRMGF